MTTKVLLLLLAIGTDGVEATTTFSDLQIKSPYQKILLADPILMEVAGAKLVRLRDGNQMIVAVASTVLKDKSPQERLRAERVCRVKALTSFVGEQQGVQVAHVEQLKDRTVIVIQNGQEKGKTISELLQVTKAKIKGIARDMPVVGTWKSQDGQIFYLAIGVVCDRKGKRIVEKE